MSNITGGFMFPTFGFGEIGCINNYFLLKGDDFDDSKCDYVICAKCDLTSLFPNPDATDNVDGSDGDSIGFVVPSVDVVCDCLKESMVELRYTEGVNDDIVDMQRSAEDRYSWRDGNANSAGAPKCWDLDDAASDAPPDSDFALVENQHFKRAAAQLEKDARGARRQEKYDAERTAIEELLTSVQNSESAQREMLQHRVRRKQDHRLRSSPPPPKGS